MPADVSEAPPPPQPSTTPSPTATPPTVAGDLWDRLVANAVVGTERRPVAAQTVADVGALVQAAVVVAAPGPQGSDEAGILRAAGALAAYRRAGTSAVRANTAEPSAPEPAEHDPRPDASTAATGLLELLLEGHAKVPGGPNTLVVEWLERCAASGHRPPPRLLPTLLDHATRQRDLREAVVAAGGPRLTWLAARNPLWEWAAAMAGATDPATSDAEVWQTGEHTARLARLVAVRSDDPAAALALVQTTWSGEKARDRVEILDVLRRELSPADEPFLEQALDDRAAAVRPAAADMLAGLTSSALAQRMTDRLRPLVTLGGRSRRRRLGVVLPEYQPDDVARRDGLRDDGAPPAVGLRTWWLIQLVQATPLAFWTDELGLSPAEALWAAAEGGHPELRDGWATAVRRQRDGAWARELVKDQAEAALLRALPAVEAWAAAEAALPSATDGMVPGLLAAVPRPWPEGLTQAALSRLRASRNSVATEQGLVILAGAADQAVVDGLEHWQSETGKHDRIRHQLRSVMHAVSIRQTILQEFP